MSVTLEILNEQEEPIAPSIYELLQGLIQTAAQAEKVNQGEVAVTFVDNEQIRRLNREFRDLDKPTDVLSFPLEEEDALGDIIISLPRAKEQAGDYGHSLDREIGFLAVHGFLHLLGYDHHTEAEEKEMFARQELILSTYGLKR